MQNTFYQNMVKYFTCGFVLNKKQSLHAYLSCMKISTFQKHFLQLL